MLGAMWWDLRWSKRSWVGVAFAAGVGHIAPFNQASLLAHLAQQQITSLGPAASNFGLEGDGLSLDTHDQDGKMIELRCSISAHA